jgi:peptidase M23-like protein/palmitoyl protein thioesterase
VIAGVAAILVAAPAAASSSDYPATMLRAPVDGPIGRGFEAPQVDWGPGHRGLDYVVPAGTAVAAAADGIVSWAGPVAGVMAVTIDHGGGLESTYSDLAEIYVVGGQPIDSGTWLGRTSLAHAGGGPGLHFGVKLDGRYVDPRGFLAPLDIADGLHLVPLVAWPPGPDRVPSWLLPAIDRAGTADRACGAVQPMASSPPPPSDNVAVAIAGIGSKTKDGISADMYEAGPELLGYAPDRVYRFSYAGIDGDDLHIPYPREATFGDLHVAAGRLEELLFAIGKRHPGSHVDLIAHSQGGIVARIYLQTAAESGRTGLPQVDHLVTFATPHKGAPGAESIAGLDRATLTGSKVLDAVSWLTRHGIALPDPRSLAAQQLSGDSSLVRWLQTEDLPSGTRALALAIPDDVVVPVDRALYETETSAVVPPALGWAHGQIVSSPVARALAYSFLRDAAPACPGGWGEWGRMAGAGISWLEGRIPSIYRQVEAGLLGLLGVLM